jgi:hypothetical protein
MQSLVGKFKKKVIGWGGSFFITTIGRTVKLKIAGWDYMEEVKKKYGNVIYAFWHGEQFLLAYFFRKKGIYLITSLSRDGEYQTEIMRRLGYRVVRGDNRRGGVRGLLSLIEKVKAGFEVALAVDGPLGPRHQPKPGVIFLAKKTRRPIIPISTAAKKSKIFEKAWDKYLLPFPFTGGAIVIGPPLSVAPEEKNITSLQQKLKEILLENTQQAQKMLEED